MFCYIYRWFIENDLDTHGLIQRPTLTGHLSKCSGCRGYYEQLTQLGRQLNSQPSGSLSESQLQGIEQAVFGRLSDKSLGQVAMGGYTYAKPPHFLRTAVTVAAAVMLVAMVGLVTQFFKPQPMLQDPIAQFGNQSQQIRTQVPLLACMAEQSMQTEIQKLAADANNAIRFLRNCTPSQPAEQDALSRENESQNTGQ